MEENMQVEQTESGISLMDIVKMLLGKIKLLIFVLLAGAIAGCSLGIATTYNTHYYGAALEFYVNPRRSSSATENQSQYGVYGAYGKNVMDNMVKLLSSESFAEKLMLDESGLPRDWLEADMRADMIALIEEANAAVDAVTAIEEELEEMDKQLPIIQEDYNFVNQTYSEVNAAYKSAQALLQSAQSGAVGSSTIEEYKKAVEEAEAELEEVKAERDEKYEALYQIKINRIQKDLDREDADEKALELLEEVEKAKEDILNEWRQTYAYKQELMLVKNSLKFAYLEDEEISATDTNDFARSFFYVQISSLNDEDFAKFLRQRIKEELPIYIEANMAVPSGYDGTNCLQTTRIDTIHDLNPGLMKNQALKYGLLLAAAAFVVACVVVIIMENANRKLDDYTVLTKNFNLPVLGVIPEIDSEEMEASAVAMVSNNSNRVEG